MKKSLTYDIVTVAIVAALYVVLTMGPLSAISYGAIQFRVSEMLNFMAFFNRKYIISLTVGCMISNLISFTWIDVIVGGLSTLVFLSLGVMLFDRFKKQYFFSGQLNKAFFFFAIFFAVSMVTIALELTILFHSPFLWTWFTLFLGEFAALFVGAIVMDKLGKRIDLTR